MFRRRTIAEVAVVVASLALVMTALFAGLVTGADSRILYVGTHTDSTGANDKLLLPTTVRQGGGTRIDVTVANGDNQNIAHVNLSFPGTDSGGATIPLRGGLTIAYVFGPDAARCTTPGAVPAGTASFSCNFENLAAGDSRTISILVNAASGFPTNVPNAIDPPALFTTSIITNNENGSNLQKFAASSGAFSAATGAVYFKVLDASGDDIDTYVAPTSGHVTSGTTGDLAGANHLKTSIGFDASAADGNLVHITDASGTAVSYDCPTGLGVTCQPDATTVTIDDGTNSFGTAPYLDWKLTALVPKTFTLSKAFVAHYPTGSTTSDWQLFWAVKGDQCGATPATVIAAKHHCIKTATLSKPDRLTGFETLFIEVLTDQNGGMRY